MNPLPRTADELLPLLQRLGLLVNCQVHEILFRNAGVGVMWFDHRQAGAAPALPSMMTPTERSRLMREYSEAMQAWTKRGLVVHRYHHKTLRAALTEEILRVQGELTRKLPGLTPRWTVARWYRPSTREVHLTSPRRQHCRYAPRSVRTAVT